MNKSEKINFNSRELKYLLTLVRTEKRKRKYNDSKYSLHYQIIADEIDANLIDKLKRAVDYQQLQYMTFHNLIKDGETVEEAVNRNYLLIQERIQKEI